MGSVFIRNNDDINAAHRELVEKVFSSFSWDQMKWSDRYTEYKSKENFSKLIKKNTKGNIDKLETSECYVWDVFNRLKDAICGKSGVSLSKITQEQGDELCKQLKLLSGLILSNRYYTDGRFEESVRKHCRWFGKYKKDSVKVKISKEVAEKIANFGVIRVDDMIGGLPKSANVPIVDTEEKKELNSETPKDGNILPPVGTRLWMLENGRVVRCEIVNPQAFEEKTTIKRVILILNGAYVGVWSPSPCAIVDLIWGKNLHNGWSKIYYQIDSHLTGNSKKATDVMEEGYLRRTSYEGNRITVQNPNMPETYRVPEDEEKIPTVKEVFEMPTLAMWKNYHYVKPERKQKTKVGSDGLGMLTTTAKGKVATSGMLTVTVDGNIVAGEIGDSSVVGYANPVMDRESFDSPPLHVQLKEKYQELWIAFNENRITRSDFNDGLDELEDVSQKIEDVESLREEIRSKDMELAGMTKELIDLGFTM